MQGLQVGKKSGFLLIGLLKWLRHAFQLLDHLLDLGQLHFQRFRQLFVLLDFLQNGSKSRFLLLGRFFQLGGFRQSRLLLLFRFGQGGGLLLQFLFQFLHLGFLLGNLFLQGRQVFFLLGQVDFHFIPLRKRLVQCLFLFSDWLGFSLLERFLDGLLTIRDLLPFVLALL